MSVSETPCTSTRRSRDTRSARNAEPETVAIDQPRPSSTSPVVTAACESAPRPQTSTAATSMPWEASIIRIRPILSASAPTSGESAYMPAMCREMVNPMTTRMSAVPWCMACPGVAAMSLRCTGVMDMTPTITRCATTIVEMPSIAPGDCRAAARPVASEPRLRPGMALAVGCPAASSKPRASMIGSGRSPMFRMTMASTMPAREKRNGPLIGGSPRLAPSADPGPIRFGPATAPTVIDQTTRPRSRPRVASSARSVAAKRACRLAADPTPSSAAPSISTAKLLVTGASIMSTAPIPARK